MADFTFKRSEQKYLLNEQQAAAFLAAMDQYMTPDKYPVSSIRNIYYDTPDFRLIRRSLEKPVYKEKIRLRSYGDATPDSKVFLEMKKKYQGIVYKRRVSLKESEATAYMADPAMRLDRGQIGRELDYFKDFYATLRPALYLSYERRSWFCTADSLRITMDHTILYRTDQLTLTVPPSGESLLEPGQYLVEIKAPGAMPLWLVHLLTEEKIMRTSFSKYGTAYLRLLKEHKIDCRGFHYDYV